MSQRGNTWELPLGDSQSYSITIFNGANPPTAITGVYAGTEPLAAYVWQGLTQAAIPGVITPAWASAAAGTTTAVVNGAAPGLSAGWYRVRLDVTFGGQTSPYYAGWLSLLAVPGSGTPAPTYCAYQDLVDRAGDWLPRMQAAGGQTDFAFERGRARSWLDELIVGKSRPYAYDWNLTYAIYYGSFPFGPVEAPDSWIRGYLASNFLMLNDRVKDIVSYKSLAIICEHRQSFDSDGFNYRAAAVYYHAKATQSLRGYRAEIDTDGDGTADLAFNMGVFTFR